MRGAGGASALALPATAGERLHLTLVDPLRILASFCVVHHHVRGGDDPFGLAFGLFLFLTILFALAASSRKRESLSAFARRKAAYLLTPWLRWSLFYFVLFALKDHARGLDPSARWRPAMLLYGADPFLWFLPFAAVSVVAARALRRALARWPAAHAVAAASLAGALATASVTAWLEQSGLAFPARSWVRVAPLLLWGLAVGETLRARTDSDRRELLLLVTLVAALCVRCSPSSFEDLPLRTAVAVALASIGFAWRPSLPSVVRELGTLTFGVYVAHTLVNVCVDRLLGWSAWPAVLHAASAWTAAALFVLALRRAGLSWSECSPARPALLGAAHAR